MPLGLSGVEFITQYMPGRWNHVPANEDPLERLARLAATLQRDPVLARMIAMWWDEVSRVARC